MQPRRPGPPSSRARYSSRVRARHPSRSIDQPGLRPRVKTPSRDDIDDRSHRRGRRDAVHDREVDRNELSRAADAHASSGTTTTDNGHLGNRREVHESEQGSRASTRRHATGRKREGNQAVLLGGLDTAGHQIRARFELSHVPSATLRRTLGRVYLASNACAKVKTPCWRLR